MKFFPTPVLILFLACFGTYETTCAGFAGDPGLQDVSASAQTSQPQASPTLQPLSSDSSPSPDTLEQARRLIQTDRGPEAEALLRNALHGNPRSPDLNFELAYCLLRENKATDALRQYTFAASLRTPTADELVNVGQAYVLLNDLTDADRWTLRAIRTEPSNAEAWYSLGRIRYTNQRFDDALSCFQRALSFSPRNARIENNLGLTEDALNHIDNAIAAYSQAIVWQEADPAVKNVLGSEQPYLNLAIVFLHRGQLDDARPLLDHAVAISPHDPHIHEQLGHLHLQQGDVRAAAASFAEADRLDPNQSSLHFLLGQCYRRLGETARAQAEFAEAERLIHDTASAPQR
jgi:Flp pilus assembly protein TadD